jgi:glycopeptide antibiotics resistance protein
MRIDLDYRSIGILAALFFPIALILYRKKLGLVKILFIWIFYTYIIGALSVTVFPIYFVESMRVVIGQNVWSHFNLIPLVFIGGQDIKATLLNILLFMPFGFFLPFIKNIGSRKTILRAVLFSIFIEAMQFALAFVSGFTLRYIDINDVIFNTLGGIIGYILFVLFVKVIRYVVNKWSIYQNPILKYIVERPQV